MHGDVGGWGWHIIDAVSTDRLDRNGLEAWAALTRGHSRGPMRTGYVRRQRALNFVFTGFKCCFTHPRWLFPFFVHISSFVSVLKLFSVLTPGYCTCFEFIPMSHGRPVGNGRQMRLEAGSFMRPCVFQYMSLSISARPGLPPPFPAVVADSFCFYGFTFKAW